MATAKQVQDAQARLAQGIGSGSDEKIVSEGVTQPRGSQETDAFAQAVEQGESATDTIFQPYQFRDARGRLVEQRDPNTTVVIEEGMLTPQQELEREADDLRDTLSNVTDAQQRRILNEQLQRINEAIAAPERRAGALSDLKSQREATMKEMEKRREEIRTAEGEAGRMIERGLGSLQQQRASRSGAQSTAQSGLLTAAAEGGARNLTQAIASDPQLASLRNRLVNIGRQQEGIREQERKVSQAEFNALQNFFVDLEAREYEEAQTAALAQEQAAQVANERLSNALTDESLAAIAENPTLAADLIDAFPDATLTLGEITARATLQKKINEIEAKKQPSEKEQLQLNKLRAEVAEIGKVKPTARDQNITTLTNLRDNGIITQADFEKALDAEIGIGRPTEIDRQIKEADLAMRNAKTEQEFLKAAELRYKLQQNNAISADGVNVIQTVSQIPDNADTDTVYENYGITRTGDRSFKGQCGAFVNDVLKTPSKYGNSLAEKTRNINSFNPTPGAVFVSRRGNSEVGHVGFVESVNGDGTVTLTDVNRGGKGRFNRRIVPIESLSNPNGEAIIGYEDLTLSAQKGNIGAPEKTSREINIEAAVNGQLPFSDLKSSVSQSERAGIIADFTQSLSKKASEEGDPVVQSMILTRAKRNPTQTNNDQIQKAFSSVGQLTEIMSLVERLINDGKVGPVSGRFASANIWDADVNRLERLLQGLVPGVARGTFGEVGVLTDADIANYKKVIGNINNTPEQLRAANVDLAEIIIRNMQNGFQSSAYNVSDYIPTYKTTIQSLPEDVKEKIGYTQGQATDGDLVTIESTSPEYSQYISIISRLKTEEAFSDSEIESFLSSKGINPESFKR